MQYELQIFHNTEHHELRTIMIDGEPWFVLADVCRALGMADKKGGYGHHAERLDEDEKRLVQRSEILEHPPAPEGGAPIGSVTLLAVSESGMFALILGSNKPEAKRLRKWVTSEVLPAIRKRGSYSVGGKPVSAEWQPFHDRITSAWGAVAEGYFSIFKEMADITAQLISQGVPVDHKTIPDIVLGMAWGKVWIAQGYEHDYGPRITYAHCYPKSFPQHKSNPQWAKCYPEDALATYRRWVRNVFLPKHLPGYLDRKTAKGDIPPAVAKSALKALGVNPVVRVPAK